MKKIDLKNELNHLYQPSAKQIVEVDVPSFQFLMIDGQGDPNTSPEYTKAVEVLFSVAYTVKFLVKKGRQHIDYAVMPFEGLWWADDLSAFVANDRAQWKWTMMILQPSFVSEAVIKTAMAEVTRKKALPAVSKLRFEIYAEGLCAQVLHIGPFPQKGQPSQRCISS